MKDILDYVSTQKDKHLAELIDFLKMPSISSLSEHKNDVLNTANWLSEHLKSIGLTDTKIIPTAGHPIVYSEWLQHGNNAPTVLIYGHYDVQPIDPIEKWKSNPFEPVISQGKIWGRGTADDKGQLFTHVKAIEAFLKIKGKLPVNIKMIFEGEEEAAESHIDEFIENNAELLKCDTVLISDTEWIADGMPSICYALRGICFMEISIVGPNRDLHSGTFGGAIDNPINTLCYLISKMKDNYGRITIPGFYDDVLELTEKERNDFLELPFNEKEYCKDLEIPGVNGEYGFTTLERVWARPTIDVNGIYGGFTGEGSKTIITTHATAKISMRLVPHQNPEDIKKKVEKYLKEITPPTVKLQINAIHAGSPVLVPQDSNGIKACKVAFKNAFGKEPVFMREGGSIPVVEVFQRVLNAPSVLMGIGLPTDNIHSPNENLSLDNFYGGIVASAIFFDEYSKL